MSRRWWVAATALVAVSVAGCSSQHAQPPPGKSAAEPAVSPSLTVTPAGTVTPTGSAPEGIVYDARTRLVAVAVRESNRLQLYDGATMRLRKTVVLPGHARHLQLGYGGGAVLVPVEDANVLVEVALPSGRITRRTAVGNSPHDAAELISGDIVTGDEFGRSLTVVRNGAVQRTISAVVQPGGVVAVGNTTVVVDVQAYTVSTFDAATGTRTALLDAGAGPTHGTSTTPGQVEVTDTRGNAVLVFGTGSLAPRGRLDLPGTPYGIAADARTHTVWVTLTARNQVVGLDVSTGTPREIARYPTVQQPDTVAVAPGGRQLWITGTAKGELEHITR